MVPGTGSGAATTPTYDANGNLTRDETGRKFEFDAWNRLVRAKNSGGTTITEYKYDALSRRVSETKSGTTTDFYYSAAWQVLEERVGGAAKTQYVWSPVYVDAMILRDRDADGNGSLEERLWVQQDANWNVTALLDNSGNVVERFAYDPFGNFTVNDANWIVRGGSSYAWVHQHQGLHYDATVTLYYNRFRWYDADFGRFVTNDPKGYAAGDVDLYRYVRNIPTGAVDPSGLETPTASKGLPPSGKGTPGYPTDERHACWSKPDVVKKRMRAKLAELAKNLPDNEAKLALAELERLIKTADEEPHPGKLSQNCIIWSQRVDNKYGIPKSKAIKVSFAWWEHWIVGIPFTSHRLGHQALKVTFSDGSVFYLDDGWWNHYFEDQNVPAWWGRYEP